MCFVVCNVIIYIFTPQTFKLYIMLNTFQISFAPRFGSDHRETLSVLLDVFTAKEAKELLRKKGINATSVEKINNF